MVNGGDSGLCRKLVLNWMAHQFNSFNGAEEEDEIRREERFSKSRQLSPD